MKAILRKIDDEFYTLETPLGRISNSQLVVTITRQVQVLQGCWLIYEPFFNTGKVHSIFKNYRDFKTFVQIDCKCEMIREKTEI